MFNELMIEVMKKTYIQPVVELTQLMASSIVLAVSGGTGIGSGGSTGGLGGTDPIPGE